MNENISPNHAEIIQPRILKPFAPMEVYPRTPRAQSGLLLRSHQESVAVIEIPWPLVVSPAKNRLQPAPELRERIALNHDWHVHFGDPDDATSLGAAPLRQLKPITGGFLSALEDDGAPVVHRGAAAECNFGRELAWLQPDFAEMDWELMSLQNSPPMPQAYHADGKHVSWFRRSFVVPTGDHGRQIYLEVAGFNPSLVWLNGHCLGQVGNGCKSFRSDITRHLSLGSENILVLRVERPLGPSTSSVRPLHDRTIYLVQTNALHLGPEATTVTGKLRNGDKADLFCDAFVHNANRDARRGSLIVTLLDPAGRALSTVTSPFHIFGQDCRVFRQTLCIADADWLLGNPGHYFVQTKIILDGCVHDEEITPFDLRSALFAALRDGL